MDLRVTPVCPYAAKPNTARRPASRSTQAWGCCVPGRPAGRPGTQGYAILNAQKPEPRPHSQKTALPDSRSHANGLLSGLGKHLKLPRGFYSALHIVLVLGFMALARIRPPEGLRDRKSVV